MKQSESIKELATALSKFQGGVTTVLKDATVQTPKFSYKYAGLPAVIEHIRPEMTKNGLAIVQACEPLMDAGHLAMETMLLHSSGEWISGYTLLKLVNDDPQGMGSAITYARRYGLCAILGIAADEDDDAVTAQASQGKKTEVKKAGGQPPDTGDHFCKQHGVKFFKTEKMKSYAHKIAGTKEWCYEYTKKDTPAEEKPNKIPPLKDLGDLYTRAAKYGLNSRDICNACGVGAGEEIADWDGAWLKTVEKFKVQIKAFIDKSK